MDISLMRPVRDSCRHGSCQHLRAGTDQPVWWRLRYGQRRQIGNRIHDVAAVSPGPVDNPPLSNAAGRRVRR